MIDHRQKTLRNTWVLSVEHMLEKVRWKLDTSVAHTKCAWVPSCSLIQTLSTCAQCHFNTLFNEKRSYWIEQQQNRRSCHSVAGSHKPEVTHQPFINNVLHGPAIFRQNFHIFMDIQSDQNVSAHLTITIQKNAKIQYFKQFQSFAIFFSETLNSHHYCDDIVHPFIVQLKEDEIDKACFQQDGATTHTAHMSMALLDDVFADRTFSKTIWPPRSPDLSPPHFFLWVTMKNSMYSNIPHTTDDLKAAITK